MQITIDMPSQNQTSSLAHLRISLQQAEAGNLKPLSELWDGIDD